MTEIGKLLVRLTSAAAVLLGLFLAVYLPAFAIVAALHLTVNRAVPSIIVLTLLSAALLIVLIARRKALSVAEFGFRTGDKRYTGYAVVLGVPLSAIAAILLGHFHEPGPLAGLRIAPWLAFIYFGLAAPFQEEVIFRGLLQTSFARSLASLPATTQNAGRIAVLVIAALFAATHLEVGPLTATCAFVLATLAGELRRRSGSLSPAIVCHSLFNIAGMVRALST